MASAPFPPVHASLLMQHNVPLEQHVPPLPQSVLHEIHVDSFDLKDTMETLTAGASTSSTSVTFLQLYPKTEILELRPF